MYSSTLTWAKVRAFPWPNDTPAKINTNKHNKILLSPASTWHEGFELEIGYLLKQSLTGIKVMANFSIETAEGTCVADAIGALEVRLYDEKGYMEFFTKGQSKSVPRSVMCPDFL